MDLDVMLEAVEKYMGEQFADMLSDEIREGEAQAFNSGVERGKRQMAPYL
jgi:hypothetical protein